MFLNDVSEFTKRVKLKKSTDTTSYRNIPLGNSGSNIVSEGLRGNYYYDTSKGSRTGLVVNNRGNVYNLPRIESQLNRDMVYGGLGRNKYFKQLSKQTRTLRTVRKRGDKTYKNTRKVTQTIDTSPNTPSSTKSTYVPKKLSEVNTTPRQTVNTSYTTPKPQSQQTANPRVDKSSSTQPKPKTPVTSSIPPKPTGKKSSKFINKYSLGALGAAGVLTGGYLGYRAYQKRKKEDKK